MNQIPADLPNLLLIMGHPRSGTTILNRICSNHPELGMTREFNNMILPQSYLEHFNEIRKNFLRKNPIIYTPGSMRRMRLNSLFFLLRYLFWLRIYSRGSVTPGAMQRTLGRLFPGARWVGDKKPTYCWKLSNFDQVNTRYIMIYRDGRDVVQSALNRSWAKSDTRFSTARKTAKKWVKAIEIMEKNQERLYIIRYEDLVKNPGDELTRLADYLNIDPAGFRPEMIKSDSIGKYKSMLSDEQITEIAKVAGPTLERLGYIVDLGDEFRDQI